MVDEILACWPLCVLIDGIGCVISMPVGGVADCVGVCYVSHGTRMLLFGVNEKLLTQHISGPVTTV